MSFFSEKQKLFIKFSDKPSEVSLETAFAGAVGTMNLGKQGVRLWVPGDDIALENEIIFDIRLRPLNEQDFETFKAACKGRYMSAYVALMASTNPKRIKAMLKYYDYVLVPNKKIKNTPEDFRNRILSYEKNIQD